MEKYLSFLGGLVFIIFILWFMFLTIEIILSCADMYNWQVNIIRGLYIVLVLVLVTIYILYNFPVYIENVLISGR